MKDGGGGGEGGGADLLEGDTASRFPIRRFDPNVSAGPVLRARLVL